MTDRGNPGGPPAWPTQPAPPANGLGSGPSQGGSGPGQDSPWWTDALHDPWRDPRTPAAVTVPSVPADPGPSLEPLPEEPAGATRPALRLVFLVAVVTALLAGGLGGALGYVVAARTGGPAVTGDGSAPPLAKRPPDSVAGVVKQVMPSLVTVLIKKGSDGGTGAGFVISADGYVVTNQHVALGAGRNSSLMVVFSDGTSASAKLVGTSAESDIAVLKVARNDLKPVTFGDSEQVAVGDPVIAVGAPLGLQNTVTTGVVSALDRAVTSGEGDPSVFAAIQTDAPINPGNSGGALLDTGGRVIGVNTAIYTLKSGVDSKGGSIGLGFAIPINQAKRVATEIVRTGHARSTVFGAEVDQDYRSVNGGVLLSSVVAGGPADKAGLKSDDVVTKLGGRPLQEPIDLVALTRKYAPGTVVSVVYVRGGTQHTIRITLGADE